MRALPQHSRPRVGIRPSTITALMPLTALLWLSCAGPDFHDWFDLKIWTDQLQYMRSTDSLIQVRLANQTERPVYYWVMQGEIQRDTGWANLGVWYAVTEGAPLRVAPGDTIAAVPLRLASLAENGVYRFHFTLSEDERGKTSVPVAFALSNWFDVIH